MVLSGKPIFFYQGVDETLKKVVEVKMRAKIWKLTHVVNKDCDFNLY